MFPPGQAPIELKLNPGEDRVWVRHEADGSVTMVAAEPVDPDQWRALHIHSNSDAPTQTVTVQHSPDGGWIDLTTADHLDELARHAAEHNLYELTAEPRDMR